MDVYFIRHGETDGNVAKRHQHHDTELNEVGQIQAEMVADRVMKIKPTHIITSTNLRAVETTRIIAKRCPDVIPETNTLFEELKRPDWLTGDRFFGLTTVLYILRWFLNYKIEGGESYDDFAKRIIEARSYLESLPDDSCVVVVSHSVFINLFLEYLHSDKKISFWRACRRLVFILTMRNVEMIHLECIHPRKWRITSVINKK